jgi:predicted ribosome-associated RNA-binding protein Tma20
MKITYKSEKVETVELKSLDNGAVFKFLDNADLYVKGVVTLSPNVKVPDNRTVILRLKNGAVSAPIDRCQVIPVSAELLVGDC